MFLPWVFRGVITYNPHLGECHPKMKWLETQSNDDGNPHRYYFSAANGVFLHFNRREIHQLEQLLTDFVAIFWECSKVYNQRAIIG